jgi:hypothetical protein
MKRIGPEIKCSIPSGPNEVVQLVHVVQLIHCCGETKSRAELVLRRTDGDASDSPTFLRTFPLDMDWPGLLQLGCAFILHSRWLQYNEVLSGTHSIHRVSFNLIDDFVEHVAVMLIDDMPEYQAETKRGAWLTQLDVVVKRRIALMMECSYSELLADMKQWAEAAAYE